MQNLRCIFIISQLANFPFRGYNEQAKLNRDSSQPSCLKEAPASRKNKTRCVPDGFSIGCICEHGPAHACFFAALPPKGRKP